MNYRAISPLMLFCVLSTNAFAENVDHITIDPPALHLRGPGAIQLLLVEGKLPDGRIVDLTRLARFTTADARTVTVSPLGAARAQSDGKTLIEVQVSDRKIHVPVEVTSTREPRTFNFENDIIPLLSRFGCNSSGCHGKAEGQNGFKLSVFGFDPAADYAALTQESRGRRVFPAAPEHSLLLTKASGMVPHGGGQRIPRNSPDYATLRAWIAAGAPLGSSRDPAVTAIRLEPRERFLRMRSHGKGRMESLGMTQQLRVIASFSDGRKLDVTSHARFQSNNEGLATVDADGLVTAGESPGDVAVMASYMNHVDVFRAVIPRAERVEPYPRQQEHNFIDRLVFAKLQKLNIVPSDLADDSEYLRRVYLDVIGTLPTTEETRRFLGDPRADKRARLVDALLHRPEYADYWALKWSDILRVDRQALGHKRAYGYYRWIRESLATNKPLDRFVRELLTAEGPLSEVGPASFYKAVPKPGEAASTLSQALLGVRIACAECHHHPFDRWGQSDYFGMVAFFAPLGIKDQGGELLRASGAASARHPRSGEVIHPHPLGASVTPAAGDDVRQSLASWWTSPANPWFARNLANRYWAHFLGRGLVEPVDDVRLTNPPSHPELLDALAQNLVDSHFDVQQMIRAITASRTYQLASRPNPTNERDEQNYSRASLKRLDAEVLLDMVCQTTGQGEKFPGVPAGYRAIQLWDSKSADYFLRIFGRPVRASACECERGHEPSVAQVLHFLNSPNLHAKLVHEAGTVARLERRLADDGALVDELYLTFFNRYPAPSERSLAIGHLRKDPEKRREAAEDLAWSMMNSLEFAFNH